MLDVPGPRLLRTPSRFALEIGRLAVDVLPRPGRLPRSTADLDATTLSGVLGREVSASGARRDDRHDRPQPARRRGRGLPGSVFVKMAATDAGTRLFGGLARLGEVEIGFYRDLRPGLAIEAPEVLGACFDRATGRFVIVLEDLTGVAPSSWTRPPRSPPTGQRRP